MSQKNHVQIIAIGAYFLAAGLWLITEQEIHRPDATPYLHEKTYRGETVSSEIVSGAELNSREPKRVNGIHLFALLSGGFGAWMLYDGVKSYKQDRRSNSSISN